MSGELYSDYMNREPHPRNAVFIRKWHGKLLRLAIKDLENTPRTVLEIGPGHGYFAQHVRANGMSYSFCDTSPAVVARMTELGFSGELGLVHEVTSRLGRYDMIWMSHVLEHSPTWLDARIMVAAAKELLTETGCLVIVGPDALTWRREFWNVDWSHGYPTTVRNVSQLLSDVGMKEIVAIHHRNGSTSIWARACFTLLSLIPHRLVDRLLTPVRYRLGDGYLYSWKVIFGWRQILVRGNRPNAA